ncbi:hypothetical protein BJ322DRAFT_1112192 [Thelephora terrestris]|uniref:C2H2-type domain-containing protein n=1 Tax=Thelephora terrestris TaxID=56493 RepID=A0A9P6H7H9_9AGAM|nr:hypothetical protein BJ322DRAFT_1112192 [Thelephora terrestris]
MFPQLVLVPVPPTYHEEAATRVYDFSTDSFLLTMHDDHVLMGDIAYDFLAQESNATLGQPFPNFLGYPPLSEVTYDTVDLLPPTSRPAGTATFPDTTNDPPSPSPSSSQASSSPGHHQTSHEPSSTPELRCQQATPVLIRSRGKWCCSACDISFRGRWECARHIETAGKRAKCPACSKILSVRDDGLSRHLKNHCKGDLGN